LVILNAIESIFAPPHIILIFSSFTGLSVVSTSTAPLAFSIYLQDRYLVMDPCANKIVKDIYFSKSTALVESNPTNLARGNLAKPSAIEEPSQRADFKGTNTECEYGVDGQVSVLQSPIHPPAHASHQSILQLMH